ncbi:MAG: hypothetical protein WC956_00470 [bacterium]
MMKTLTIFISIAFAICTSLACTSCGGSAQSGGGGSGGESALDGSQWRAITNSGAILAGIAVEGTTGTLTVVNNSDVATGTPAVAMYDFDTGQPVPLNSISPAKVASGQYASADFTFSDGTAPADTALMTLTLGDDQAAVFMPSSAYSDLSPIVFDPALSTYINPTSGEWGFEMDLGTEYLTGANCPSTPLGMVSSGECALTVSTNGYAAAWTIEDSVIALNRSALSNTFESATYYFEVESESGTVYGINRWMLTPSSSTAIAGMLEWNNNLGCSANYPIRMNYNLSSSPVIHQLCEGLWNISYSTMACGGNAITPASLPMLPYPQVTLDVTYLIDDPVYLTLGSLSGYQSLPNVGGTNIYGTLLPNVVLGTIDTPLGPPLTIVAGLQLTAVSPTQMMGVLMMNGYGITPCSGTGVVMMTSVTGC